MPDPLVHPPPPILKKRRRSELYISLHPQLFSLGRKTRRKKVTQTSQRRALKRWPLIARFRVLAIPRKDHNVNSDICCCVPPIKLPELCYPYELFAYESEKVDTQSWNLKQPLSHKKKCSFVIPRIVAGRRRKMLWEKEKCGKCYEKSLWNDVNEQRHWWDN